MTSPPTEADPDLWSVDTRSSRGRPIRNAAKRRAAWVIVAIAAFLFVATAPYVENAKWVGWGLAVPVTLGEIIGVLAVIGIIVWACNELAEH